MRPDPSPITILLADDDRMLTTSRAEEDILRSYDLGVNSFITKPVSFEELVEVMRALKAYWFEIVLLPAV